jgi:hypothetical protein
MLMFLPCTFVSSLAYNVPREEMVYLSLEEDQWLTKRSWDAV